MRFQAEFRTSLNADMNPVQHLCRGLNMSGVQPTWWSWRGSADNNTNLSVKSLNPGILEALTAAQLLQLSVSRNSDARDTQNSTLGFLGKKNDIKKKIGFFVVLCVDWWEDVVGHEVTKFQVMKINKRCKNCPSWCNSEDVTHSVPSRGSFIFVGM